MTLSPGREPFLYLLAGFLYFNPPSSSPISRVETIRGVSIRRAISKSRDIKDMLSTLSSLATRWVSQFHHRTTRHSSFSLATANHRDQDEHTARRKKKIHSCPRKLTSLICVTTRFDLQTGDHLPLFPHLSFLKSIQIH